MSAPRSSTDPPLAAAVPRPGRAPRPANVPGPLPRPIWCASAPRRAGCGSSRSRASCARRPHRSRHLPAGAEGAPARPPARRPSPAALPRPPVLRDLLRVPRPASLLLARRALLFLPHRLLPPLCVRSAASCCRRRALPASCGRSPALPFALAAPVLSLFLFLRVRSSGLCEFCESFLVSFESSFVTSDSSVSVSVWFFLI
jgi:hypothetical protein